MRRVIAGFIVCLASQLLFAQKECSSTEYADQLLKSNPALREKVLAAESFLRNHIPEILSSGIDNSSTASLPVITIPVVVHILYKDENQNISDTRVKQQIEVLNKAFNLSGSDTSKIPSYFQEFAADCRIQFVLAKIDPKGRATSGIVRKNTWVTLYGIDDRIKYSAQGGDDAWDADKYLNIWLGSLAGGIVGYSSPLGGPHERDGVAIRTEAFGTGNGGTYGGGKTLVHEVGHWLGLRHIWGDTGCGDDQVDDTPKQQAANRGCPSGVKVSCNNAPYGDMYMNFMDQVNDDCMVMFTKGQMNRMRSAFAVGGPRFALLSSDGYTGSPVTQPVESPSQEKPVIKLLQLYPNPVQKLLIIEFNEASGCLGSDMRILNQFGQSIKRIHIGQLKISVDVSGWQSGMYLIKVDRVGNFQQKFLKM